MATPSSPRGAARQRVLDASLELFVEHGVSGTSLQMIADRIGVTKAAIYFQFRTKEEILAALLEEPLRDLLGVLEQAENERDRARRADVVVEGLVDTVLAHRRGTSVLMRDPGSVLALKQSETYQRVAERLRELLLGAGATQEARVRFVVLMGGLTQVGVSPVLRELDDDTLRPILRQVATQILER